MITDQELKQNRIAHLTRVGKKLSKMPESCRQIFEAMREGEGEWIECRVFMLRNRMTTFDGLLAGDFVPFVRCLLSSDWADLLLGYLPRFSLLPYTLGWFRCSLRSDDPILYSDKIMMLLDNILSLDACGLRISDVIQADIDLNVDDNDVPYSYAQGIRQALIALVAANDIPAVDYLKAVMQADSDRLILARHHLLAVAVSGRPDLLEMEAHLLLNARLQEGLRQMIAESIDEGTPESFIYYFNLIIEHNLLRFSSVVRGMITTVQQSGEPVLSERKNRQVAAMIQTFVNDEAAARKALDSDNPVEFYLALWSLGFRDVSRVINLVPQYIREGSELQVQTLFVLLEKIYPRYSAISINAHPYAVQALLKWYRTPKVVAFVLPLYLRGVEWGSIPAIKRKSKYFGTPEEIAEQIDALQYLVETLPDRLEVTSYAFADEQSLMRKDVANQLLMMAFIADNEELEDRALPYLSQTWDSDSLELVSHCLSGLNRPIYRQVMLERLKSVEGREREVIVKTLSQHPGQDVVDCTVKLLGRASNRHRESLFNLLKSQGDELLADGIKQLLADGAKNKCKVAFELLYKLRNEGGADNVLEAVRPSESQWSDFTPDQRAMLEEIYGSADHATDEVKYTPENGFGLYDPRAEYTPPVIDRSETSLLNEGMKYLSLSSVETVFTELEALITANKDLTYTDKTGEQHILGYGDWVLNTIRQESGNVGMDVLPYPEIWKTYYQEHINNPLKALMLGFYNAVSWHMLNGFEPVVNRVFDINTSLSDKVLSWFKGKRSTILAIEEFGKGMKEKYTYYWHVLNLMGKFAETYADGTLRAKVAVEVLERLNALLTDTNCYEINYFTVTTIAANHAIAFWLELPTQHLPDESFRHFFNAKYQLYLWLTRVCVMTCPAEEYHRFEGYDFVSGHELLRALSLGIVDRNHLLRMMVECNRVCELFHCWQDAYPDQFEPSRDWRNQALPERLAGQWRSMYEALVDRVLDIELRRSELPTPISTTARELRGIVGVKRMIRILKAMEGIPISRETGLYSSDINSRSVVFTRLLMCTYPDKTDTALSLKNSLEASGISHERMVEAAVKAQQWLAITEEATGWTGLRSAVCYFTAHVMGVVSSEDEEYVSRQTPLTIRELEQGYFDSEWFHSFYNSLGAKRFDLIYNAAKYIDNNNNHGRARRYADAALGKLQPEKVRAEIEKKRNQSQLIAYTLIPLADDGESDLLERYKYIRRFLKESTGVGQQRRESERRAVEVALRNLAINAGYDNVTRLTWSMESLLVDELQTYLEPREIDGRSVCILIDDQGKASLQVVREGKILKSVPADLKKDPYVRALNVKLKELKEQYVRSRHLLEEAMVDGIQMTVDEVGRIMRHPVIAPLANNLVWLTEDAAGLFVDGKLQDPNGGVVILHSNHRLRIAHPYDLYERGIWADWQRWLFDHQERQTFKQVFRELYISTAEEAETFKSVRYSGNQVDPRKAKALLLGRDWKVDYSSGIYKVFYKQHIVAGLYSGNIRNMLFTPGDIEYPAIESVYFQCDGYRMMKLGDVPPIIFSEIMRDVDLVVSVAHAGGVVPEASHSTMEMRKLLMEHTARMLRLKQIKVEGHFIHVSGALAEYRIHLGSGEIHQAGGTHIAVIPVHSQHRGKLFLPFMDDDPKTAEILSKAILFADDKRIKDPTILSQINRVNT